MYIQHATYTHKRRIILDPNELHFASLMCQRSPPLIVHAWTHEIFMNSFGVENWIIVPKRILNSPVPAPINLQLSEITYVSRINSNLNPAHELNSLPLSPDNLIVVYVLLERQRRLSGSAQQWIGLCKSPNGKWKWLSSIKESVRWAHQTQNHTSIMCDPDHVAC